MDDALVEKAFHEWYHSDDGVEMPKSYQKALMAVMSDLRLAGVKEGLEMAQAREAGLFLLDRLVDHEVRMTSDEDAREWHGHVTPAMARFRTAIRAIPVKADH